MCLFIFAGESFRSLSYQFRVGVSTIRQLVPETCTAIYEVLKREIPEGMCGYLLVLLCKRYVIQWGLEAFEQQMFGLPYETWLLKNMFCFSVPRHSGRVAASSWWIPGSVGLPKLPRCPGWETHQHPPPSKNWINISFAVCGIGRKWFIIKQYNTTSKLSTKIQYNKNAMQSKKNCFIATTVCKKN